MASTNPVPAPTAWNNGGVSMNDKIKTTPINFVNFTKPTSVWAIWEWTAREVLRVTHSTKWERAFVRPVAIETLPTCRGFEFNGHFYAPRRMHVVWSAWLFVNTYPRWAVRMCVSIRKAVVWMVRQPFHVHWNSGPLLWSRENEEIQEQNKHQFIHGISS